MNDKEFSEVLESKGFNGIFTPLADAFALLTHGNVKEAIKTLNDGVLDTVASMTTAAKKKLAPLMQRLAKVYEANKALAVADKAVEALRVKYGFRNSDMHYVALNFLGSPVFYGTAILVIMSDFLLGGVILFHKDQSWLTTLILLVSAVGAAIAWTYAATDFAIRHRLYTERDNSNREIIADHRLGRDAAAIARLKKRQNYLPIFMQPDQKHISLEEANIYEADHVGKGHDFSGTIRLWVVKKSVNRAIWAIIFGFIFGLFRFIPVFAEPDRYGKEAIFPLIVLFVIAMVINGIAFLVEKYRRRSGLTKDLQKKINTVVHERNTLDGGFARVGKLRRIKTKIKNVLDVVNRDLQQVYTTYSAKFDNLVNTSSNDNWDADYQKYSLMYLAKDTEIKAFIEHIKTSPEYLEILNENMPDPSVAQTVKPLSKDELNALKQDKALFIVSEKELTPDDVTIDEPAIK